MHFYSFDIPRKILRKFFNISLYLNEFLILEMWKKKILEQFFFN